MKYTWDNEAVAFARRKGCKKLKDTAYRQAQRDQHQQRMERLAAEYESVFHQLYGRPVKVTFTKGWFLCNCSRELTRQRRDHLVERTQWMRAKLRVAEMQAAGLEPVEDS